MISAYWIIVFSVITSILIGWLIAENGAKWDAKSACHKWENYYYRQRAEIRSLENRLKEKRSEEKPHKITFEAELNTEQLEKDMERLKRIIGVCKHQDNCQFFDIGEDSHNSQK